MKTNCIEETIKLLERDRDRINGVIAMLRSMPHLSLELESPAPGPQIENPARAAKPPSPKRPRLLPEPPPIEPASEKAAPAKLANARDKGPLSIAGIAIGKGLPDKFTIVDLRMALPDTMGPSAPYGWRETWLKREWIEEDETHGSYHRTETFGS